MFLKRLIKNNLMCFFYIFATKKVQFKDIIGHEKIKENLVRSAKQGRISHAQLFAGPPGVGSLAFALAYAQYLNCENPGDNDSCGECKSCKKISKLIHPDLHFIFPVVKTKKISNPTSVDFIDKWREFVLSSTYHSYSRWLDFLETEKSQAAIYTHETKEIIKIINLKTFEAKYKVIIIFMPEMMNTSTANKLLKAIEEPPENTVFLLVSENEEDILKTIFSRTQLIKFHRLDDANVLYYLNQKYPQTKQNILTDVSALAEGNIIKAEEFLSDLSDDNSFWAKNFNLFKSFILTAYRVDVKNMPEVVNSIASLGKEQQKNFLRYSLRMFRESFVLHEAKKRELLHLTDREKDFSKKLSKIIHQSNIFALYEIFNKAYYEVIRNASAKILFMDLLFQTLKLLKTQNVKK